MLVQANAAKKFVGTWPLPEAFWPKTQDTLPARLPHPKLHFSTVETEPVVVEGLPFDK